MRAGARMSLEKKQQRLRDKNAGIGPPVAPLPILWSSQIDRAVMCALKNIEGLYPRVESALASALLPAIAHLEAVVISADSSVSDRTAASMTLFFLMNTLQKADIRRRSLDMRTEEIKKKRARAEERKAQHLAAKESVILTVAKERRKIDRKLRKAQAEIAAAAPQATSKEI
jgi:hypothetical protein